MNLLSIINIGDTIKEAFYGIVLLLDSFVYSLVASSYRIFMAIAGARILSSDAYTTIANKIYVIIGVVMLFVLSYAILKAIIDPEQVTKGDLGGPKLLKGIVIAILGLALTPVIFNLLYQGQTLFLEKDVLANLFFRTSEEYIDVGTVTTDDGSSYDVGKVYYNKEVKNIGGAVAAVSVWKAFFHPAPDTDLTAEDIKGEISDYYLAAAGHGALAAIGAGLGILGACLAETGVGVVIALIGGAIAAYAGGAAAVNDVDNANTVSRLTDGNEISLEEAYYIASADGDFGIFTIFIPDIVEDGTIQYIWLISTVCGAIVCYAFVSFSIDMGLRAGKLAYYQIIAPIPLIMQILPSFKSNFNKYLKSIFSTFVEVFVRISVVYIVIYIVCHIQDSFSTTTALWGNSNLSAIESYIAMALLIIGLILFAKTAPKLITDTFGLQTGNMKLGIRQKLADAGVFAAGATVGGAIIGASNSWFAAKNADENATFGQKLGSAVKGGVSSAWGTAKSQFWGTGHKMSQDVRDMRNSWSTNANRASTKQAKKVQGTQNVRQARQNYDNVRAEYDDYVRTHPGATEAELRAQQDKVAAAEKTYRDAAWENSVFYDPVTEIKREFTGSVDTSQRNEIISAASSSATGFKDTIRGSVKDTTSFAVLQRVITANEERMKKLSANDFTDITNPDGTVTTSEQQFRKALADLNAQNKVLTDSIEAMQSAQWLEKLSKRDPKAMQAMVDVLKQAPDWKKYASLSVDYLNPYSTSDADKTLKVSLGELVRDFMGAEALDGNKIDFSKMLSKSVIKVDGVAYTMQLDSAGSIEYVGGGHTYSATKFADMCAGAREVEDFTAATVLSKAFSGLKTEQEAQLNKERERQRAQEGKK